MLNNGNKACGLSDEIVSYIYDEIDPAGRREFESHLAVCTACTDEFAAVSDARFSMFEWQKEEFAHLPTPEILIPYARRPVDLKAEVPAGIFAGWASLLALARSPFAIAGALGTILIVGFVAYIQLGQSGERMIAANAKVEAVKAPATEPAKIAALPVVETPKVKSVEKEIRPESAAVREIPERNFQSRPFKAPRLSNDVATQPVLRKDRKAPFLSDTNEDDEDTLRLSDVLDEIGG